MLNRVVLVGRITKDPMLKQAGENSVCNFTIAVNRQYESNGEKQADFINCVVWKKQAENLEKYVKKGYLIGIDGRLQVRTFDSDGTTKYVTEVVCDSIQFLETKKEENKGDSIIKDDDLPF